MDSKDVYLLLGSNLGNRSGFLLEAQKIIEIRLGRIVSRSSIYETEPWGFSADHYFLNQAIRIQTVLTHGILLQEIMGIERDFGRMREEKKYQSRTLDIDILFYSDQIIESKELTIPHPSIPERRFVLIPLAEIAGDFIHPVSGKSVKTLLEHCMDPLKVSLFNPC